MPSPRRLLTALLVVAFAASCPLAAHAQFGALKDRLKKKATEVVTGKPATDSAAENATNRDAAAFADTNVIVITEDVQARFEAGLHAEVARRKEIDTQLHSLKSPGDYSRCAMEYMMSEEGRNVSNEVVLAAGDPVKTEAAVNHRQEALVAHCGQNPDDYDLKRELNASVPKAGAKAAKMTPTAFAILRERELAFLSKAKYSPWHVAGDRNGTGSYVFTAAELVVLRAHESVLRELLKDEL